MKIPIKTEKQAGIMAEGGRKLASVLERVLEKLEPGVKVVGLDQLAEKLIEKEGGKASFKMVPNYHWATCINVNEGVVHGIPGSYRVKLGDLISIDLGMIYRGYHTDMARTLCVRNQKSPVRDRTRSGKIKNQKFKEKEEFLKAGQLALEKAVKAARPSNRVGHISQVIEESLGKNGLFPVRTLTGHGIGRSLHEPPSIPCFLGGKIEGSFLLKQGMVLAIEIIYTEKETDLYVRKDGWTVKTKDGSWGGLFEDTVLITPREAKVLTALN